jgi:hypothetical protein
MEDTMLLDQLDLEEVKSDDLASELRSRGFFVAEHGPEIEDFDTDDLVEHLEGKGYSISELGSLSEAHARFMRRDYPECLIQLERALPDSFSGFADRIASHFTGRTVVVS